MNKEDIKFLIGLLMLLILIGICAWVEYKFIYLPDPEEFWKITKKCVLALGGIIAFLGWVVTSLYLLGIRPKIKKERNKNNEKFN